MSTALSVARLSTTPIKGLTLDHPDSIELTVDGAVGDRRFYLIDDTGRIQSGTANADLILLAARYDSHSRRLEVVGVGVVDAGGRHLVELLALAGRRIGQVDDVEVLGAAEAGGLHGSHVVTLGGVGA